LTSSVRVPATKRFSASDATLFEAGRVNASGEGGEDKGATRERTHRRRLGGQAIPEVVAIEYSHDVLQEAFGQRQYGPRAGFR
jgi:hypothetical protein